MSSSNYHTPYLEAIKFSVGASFVSFERTGDSFAIKVIRNKKTNYFDILGSPEHATPEKYNEIGDTIQKFYHGKI